MNSLNSINSLIFKCYSITKNYDDERVGVGDVLRVQGLDGQPVHDGGHVLDVVLHIHLVEVDRIRT